MSNWRDVTPAAPCRNCGAIKWCSRSEDGAQRCQHAPWPGGKEFQDRDGATYYMSFPEGTSPQQEPKEPTEKPVPEPAPVDTLHRVYSKLLDLLGLSDAHEDFLRKKGHEPAGIEARQYRTVPKRRAQTAQELVDFFGEDICKRVPGLYVAQGERGKYWTLAGAIGIMVPCRDTQGRIAAIKIRANEPDATENRYTYLTSASKDRGGASPGRPVHVPSAPVQDRTTVRVTEGELKCDLATERSGILTIGIPGVDTWQLALPVLQELNPARVLIALDSDYRENQRVLRAILESSAVFAEHFEVEVEVWGEEHKGIDDLLVAGLEPERLTATEFARTVQLRPTIQSNDRDLPDITADTLRAMRKANDPPILFQRADQLLRVRTEKGVANMEVVGEAALRGIIARAASFREVVEGKKGQSEKTVFPPAAVVQDILGLPTWPFPRLERVVNSPIFLPDGTLLDAAGYHPDRQIFFASAGRATWNIPRSPTPAEVARAKELLTVDLMGDFPFVDRGVDVTHTVAALLLPFLREMIDGPTPLHLFSAPSPGTGKSLLADVICIPAMGSEGMTLSPSREGDEWRKTITAVLDAAPIYIMIDNIGGRLDSPDLAAATTLSVWHDRILGGSRMVGIPVVSAWLATANNPTMSDEVARRTVPIFLDAQVDEPWERQPEGGFKHAHLKAWTRANRERLITAALTLIQNWIAQGRPRCKTRLGSYESWSEVVGGVLEANGFEGFLANQGRLYTRSADQMGEWKTFLESWWGRWRDTEVTMRMLHDHALSGDLLLSVMNAKGERGSMIALGKAVRKQADRRIAGFQMTLSGGKDAKGTPTWKLVNHDLSTNLPAPAALPAFDEMAALNFEGLV